MTNPAQENVNEGTSSRANKQKGKVSKRVRSRASSPPCAACKKMRKKCSSDCIFAPYFGSSQGSARFEAVHKVFGANNLSKLLLEVEVAHRNEVINSMCYEAQARLANPVHGCVSTISALQQQVAMLQGELVVVQNQLINTKNLYESLLQRTYQYQQQPNINVVMQPTQSNNLTPSTNSLMNRSFFNPGFDNLAMQTTPSTNNMEPRQFCGLPHFNNDITHLFP
ncbi:hypothetical protein PHAVU_001G115200 [Phaseolus vulgaris]|uniref:LOB domain-containing protein n=1 Tax=Phaseolus vulgaris TaxID=3885 RepID=V7CV31_PHAVU|nr:hypothetical protein PHAVU_001G115200g [Phaseolus vulgaris]ESW33994.1 hypothetical protein PHAVU_001G115200g [Phaseolus vulgaris]